MERLMWKYIFSLLLRMLAMFLVILVPVWGFYELCSLIVPLNNPDQYAEIPEILKGAVQSIPCIGNFLDSIVTLFGLDLVSAKSLNVMAFEEIIYVLFTALLAPLLYRCYMFLAAEIDRLYPPTFEILNRLTDFVFGAIAILGSVSVAMILRDSLSYLILPLGNRNWTVLIAAIIGLLLVVTVVGSVVARGNLLRKLLSGILNLLLGILLAGCIALFSNALLLISNSTYLTGSEMIAGIICLIITSVIIGFIVWLNFRFARNGE